MVCDLLMHDLFLLAPMVEITVFSQLYSNINNFYSEALVKQLVTIAEVVGCQVSLVKFNVAKSKFRSQGSEVKKTLCHVLCL